MSFLAPTITGLFDLLGGGLNALYSSAAAKKQYKYNLALQDDAQAHQVYMYKNQNQWRVNDLRSAGLNPILSTHAASSMPSAGMNSVSMPNSANFDFKGTSDSIERYLYGVQKKEAEIRDETIKKLKAESDSYSALAKKYTSESNNINANTAFEFSPEVIRLKKRQMQYNSSGDLQKRLGLPQEVLYPNENSAYDGFRKEQDKKDYERKQFWNSFKKDLRRSYKKSFPFLGF